MQQTGGSASISVSQEWSTVESVPEAGGFYPSAAGCTGLTWQFLVRQLMGMMPAIPTAKGKIVVNIGLGSGQGKVDRIRVGNHDRMIQQILQEAGRLTTTELHEEMILHGVGLTMEALLKNCKKLEERGFLKSTKQQRLGSKGGRKINVWQIKEKNT